MTRRERNGADPDVSTSARFEHVTCPACGEVLRWEGEGPGRQNKWRRSAVLSCAVHGEMALAATLRPVAPNGVDVTKRPAQRHDRDRGIARPGEHDMEAQVLRARCWCDRREVDVPVGDVRAGRTKSCGLPGCKDTTTRRPAS